MWHCPTSPPAVVAPVSHRVPCQHGLSGFGCSRRPARPGLHDVLLSSGWSALCKRLARRPPPGARAPHLSDCLGPHTPSLTRWPRARPCKDRPAASHDGRFSGLLNTERVAAVTGIKAAVTGHLHSAHAGHRLAHRCEHAASAAGRRRREQLAGTAPLRPAPGPSPGSRGRVLGVDGPPCCSLVPPWSPAGRPHTATGRAAVRATAAEQELET